MILQICNIPLESGEFSDLPLSQKQTKAGKQLLSRMIKEHYGKSAYTVFYNENGKPLLDFCFFSISHSAERVICALSDRAIGIDIEKIKPLTFRKKYLLFSKEESRYVNTNNNPTLAFYTVWTRKEAYLKAIGGKLSELGNFSMVTDALTLKSHFQGFVLQTEESEGYVLSSAEAKLRSGLPSASVSSQP